MAAKQPAVPPDAARTLAIASRVVEKSLGDMAPDPMTLPQLRILSLIARAPERASRLASQSDVSRPTLTGVLDGLVARGWVERTEVEGDRRGVELEATSTGRAALEGAQPQWPPSSTTFSGRSSPPSAPRRSSGSKLSVKRSTRM